MDRFDSWDPARARRLVASHWENSIVPALARYIAIPAKSPAFDAEWESNGHLERAIALAAEWVEAQGVGDLRLEVVRLPGRTPVLLLEVAGSADATVLLYGHLDKQPEMTGWSAGLAPWTPVRRDDRLYGRGAADDGYAVFAAVTAIRALQRAARRARTLRGVDRDLRGERLLRPAVLHGSPARPHRHSGAGRRTRLGMRQLRAALVHDVAARDRGRRAARARARGRRALGRCGRRRAVELPNRATTARSTRGRGDRRDPPARFSRRDPRRARRAGARCGAGSRNGSARALPVRERHPAGLA